MEQTTACYTDGSLAFQVGLQQHPAFYLDGSLVLKVGASSLRPFTWMVPWLLRLEPAAYSLLPGWFLGSLGWSKRPPAFYLDGFLVLQVGPSSLQLLPG